MTYYQPWEADAPKDPMDFWSRVNQAALPQGALAGAPPPDPFGRRKSLGRLGTARTKLQGLVEQMLANPSGAYAGARNRELASQVGALNKSATLAQEEIGEKMGARGLSQSGLYGGQVNTLERARLGGIGDLQRRAGQDIAEREAADRFRAIQLGLRSEQWGEQRRRGRASDELQRQQIQEGRYEKQFGQVVPRGKGLGGDIAGLKHWIDLLERQLGGGGGFAGAGEGALLQDDYAPLSEEEEAKRWANDW